MLVLLLAGGTGFGGWWFFNKNNAARLDLILHTVKKEKLLITITERGSLESAETNELTCKVKAKAQGGNATSIRWVIDNGSIVKAGDRICELDDSALQDQKTTQQIEVLKAEGEWKKAEQARAVNLINNNGLIETARTALDVAKITLDEYVSGQYLQSKTDMEGKLMMATSDLSMWEERAAWSERMSRPGRQFVTVSQAEADQARRLSAELTHKNFKKQLEVLNELTLQKNRKDLQGKIDEQERALKRAETTYEKQKDCDDVLVNTTKTTYDMQMDRLREIEKEILNCLIRAPRDGMVVYYVEERARFGGTQGVIAQGEFVKEGQKLMSVPDLSNMVVNARVHEAMVAKVKADVMRDTGYSEAINTSLLISPDPLLGLSAYTTFLTDLKTDFINAHRRYERQLEQPGLRAMVRVNAFPGEPLRGHVKSVASVASVNDFFASDVKVYQTYIAVDQSKEGLKPGMDAVISIFVNGTETEVPTLPLQAVIGTVDMGVKRHCFVKKPNGDLERREVTLGISNETNVEVKEGLSEGEVVVLNPVLLLNEKEKMEYGNLPAQRSGQGQGFGKGGKGGGGEYPGAGGSGAPGAGGGGAPGGGGGGKRRGGGGGGMQGGGMQGGGGMPGGGRPSQAPQ